MNYSKLEKNTSVIQLADSRRSSKKTAVYFKLEYTVRVLLNKIFRSTVLFAPVAQLDRASASEAGCGRSSRPRGTSQPVFIYIYNV